MLVFRVNNKVSVQVHPKEWRTDGVPARDRMGIRVSVWPMRHYAIRAVGKKQAGTKKKGTFSFLYELFAYICPQIVCIGY